MLEVMSIVGWACSVDCQVVSLESEAIKQKTFFFIQTTCATVHVFTVKSAQEILKMCYTSKESLKI